MDPQTETSAAADPQSQIQALVDRIDERAPAERRDALAAFARAYTRRLTDEDLAELSLESLFSLVTSTFDLADGRGLHPSVVRVYNPALATDGYETTGTVVETSTDDSPFLVDSVTEELAARGLSMRRILHPVIGTSRDEAGHLERVLSARDASHRESVMHFELDRRLSDDERTALSERITEILHDVHLVVRDFEPMQDRVKHMIGQARAAAIRYSPQEVGETVDFLEWLLELNFVLLGYRDYELVDTDLGRAIRAVPASGLGILSDVATSTFSEAMPLDQLTPDVRRRIEDGDLLVFSKTNAYSTVHRRARMDYIGVRRVNAEGEIVGEARLIRTFEKIRNHYGINRVGQLGALAALEDQDYLAAAVARIARAREKIADIAIANGLKPLPSAANFVTIDCRRDAAFAKEVLHGLLARDVFARMPSRAPLNRCFRVSCGRDEDLEVFSVALAGALAAAMR